MTFWKFTGQSNKWALALELAGTLLSPQHYPGHLGALFRGIQGSALPICPTQISHVLIHCWGLVSSNLTPNCQKRKL